MGTSIRVVPASEIDLAAHVRLQRAAFARAFALLPASTVQNEAYYVWKYHTPAGMARVAQAFENGRLVGSATAVPVRFASRAVYETVWQLCDLATLRDCRGRGIFKLCLRYLLDEIGEHQPVYCLPNALSHRPLVSAGFLEIGRMRLYLTPRLLLVDDAEQSVRRRQSGWPNRPFGFAGQGLDLGNPAMLDWRFRARPGVSYRIIEMGGPTAGSTAVLRSMGGRLRVAILVALRLAPVADLAALTGELVRSMRSHGESALLTLLENPPSWRRSSWQIPERILPRRFPILSLNLGPQPTSFTAAEWDVI